LLTSRLPALLGSWERAPSAETAQALLAIWGGLRRLAEEKADPDEERLKVLVRDDAIRLTRLACVKPLFDLDDWLQRAESLDRAWDEGAEEAEELDWQTQGLFERLDRAALMLWAVQELAGPSADAECLAAARRLAKAEEFLAERVDLFVCLATDVAAVLSSLRPGLEEETQLWETVLKHRRIEEERDELATPPGRAALLASVRLAAAPAVEASGQVQALDWAWLPRPSLLMAAGVPRPGGVAHRYWREPGGGHVAVLAANRADAVTPVWINFYAGAEPATDLAGQKVWLAEECEGEIDAHGNARFAQDELRRVRAKGGPPTLRVGPGRVVWEPTEAPPF
jgi:hypothetical protein